jgi:hypothetical protein
MDANGRENEAEERRTADEHRSAQIRPSKIKAAPLENLFAYICANLQFKLMFLSSRQFVSIRGSI